jgi:hypothetical protein
MQNTMEQTKSNQGAQYEISIDGVPRTYRDRQDIALQTAQLLKPAALQRKSPAGARLVGTDDLWWACRPDATPHRGLDTTEMGWPAKPVV